MNIGEIYRLADRAELGDYRNSIIEIEAGPRNSNHETQYRVSWGSDYGECDWIEVSMFDGATKIETLHVLY